MRNLIDVERMVYEKKNARQKFTAKIILLSVLLLLELFLQLMR